MSDHIPGQHRTIFYAHYANRVRGGHERDEVELHEAAAEPPRRRGSPSWARLIARVYQVDPLLCVHCGQQMQMIAFLTDQLSIRRILEHLGFSSQPQDKPPPLREVLRVAEQGRDGEYRRVRSHRSPFRALDCVVKVKPVSVLARQAI